MFQHRRVCVKSENLRRPFGVKNVEGEKFSFLWQRNRGNWPSRHQETRDFGVVKNGKNSGRRGKSVNVAFYYLRSSEAKSLPILRREEKLGRGVDLWWSLITPVTCLRGFGLKIAEAKNRSD